MHFRMFQICQDKKHSWFGLSPRWTQSPRAPCKSCWYFWGRIWKLQILKILRRDISTWNLIASNPLKEVVDYQLDVEPYILYKMINACFSVFIQSKLVVFGVPGIHQPWESRSLPRIGLRIPIILGHTVDGRNPAPPGMYKIKPCK